jgi:putative oxidoreductase
MILDPLFKKWRTFLEGPTGSMLPDIGLLVLRISFSATMITHGWAKYANFSQYADKFPDPIGVGPKFSLILAIFSELVCSVLVILGLATRLALTQLIVTMAVAFFIVHAADPLQKKELALVYLFTYVALFITGPGRLSVDAWLIGNCLCKQKRQL